jgi:hypothetical protein
MPYSPVIFPYLLTLVSWIPHILGNNSKGPSMIKFYYLVLYLAASRLRLRVSLLRAFVCSP